MDRNLEIEILKLDGCTAKEAVRHLDKGTLVFRASEFAGNFDKYMAEWELEPEEIGDYINMLLFGNPVPDWGCVIYQGVRYLIMYVL